MKTIHVIGAVAAVGAITYFASKGGGTPSFSLKSVNYDNKQAVFEFEGKIYGYTFISEAADKITGKNGWSLLFGDQHGNTGFGLQNKK